MKPLHILDHFLPYLSGYTYRSLSILAHQRRLGWEPQVLLAPRHAHPETVRGRAPVPVAAVPLTGPLRRLVELPLLGVAVRLQLLRRALPAVLTRAAPDLVHAHSPSLNGLPALGPCRRRGLPLVYEVRALWEDAAVNHGTARPGGPRYRWSRRLETRLCAAADAVVVLCEALRDELRARGIPPEKIFVVGNGVDPEVFAPRPPDPARRRALGLGPGPLFAFVGSFYAYEGLEVLLEAIARLPVGPQLLLAGAGPEEERLRARARAADLRGRVRFAGRVPQGEVPALYALADVLVYPRLRNRLTELTTPLKPLEALAMGKAVVASDVGGLRELLGPVAGEGALLVPPGDPGALAAALAALAAAPERRRALGEAGRAFVLRERTWARQVERYREVYARARASARTGPPGATADTVPTAAREAARNGGGAGGEA